MPFTVSIMFIILLNIYLLFIVSVMFIISINMYLLFIVTVMFVLLHALLSACSSVNASQILHDDMLSSILRSPLLFFDTTPIGRVLNRFSRDIETIDNVLPGVFDTWFAMIMGVIATMVVMSYSTPIFLSIVVPIFGIYYFVQVIARYSFKYLFV